MMDYAHLNSLGESWYEAQLQQRPTYSCCSGNEDCDVAIIGGGLTGLSAAYHLARGGIRTILVEGARFGDCASGRNGGQLGTGQRQWVEQLEQNYGFERAKQLFDLAEQAKQDILDFARSGGFDIDYQQGQLSVIHHKRLIDSYKRHVDVMARYGYDKLSFMDVDETAVRLGSERFLGGIRDVGTGHINPLKLVFAFANAACKAGAILYEHTQITRLRDNNGRYVLTTKEGSITADRVLMANNAFGGMLHSMPQSYVAPLRSYIAATEPLDPALNILPGGEAVDDSRYVVRYFRKVENNVLLFGGAESGGDTVLRDIDGAIRAQLREIYPQLANIRLTHHWGGTLAITMQRLPLVRDVMPNVTYSGAYSGHGVMLAPFMGKLYAQSALGERGDINLFKELKLTPFPGGLMLRKLLLKVAMKWFTLRDSL